MLLSAMVLGLVACSPGGPSYDELSSEPVFATAMPGAREVGTGGHNPERSTEGATYGYASRMFASDEEAAAVLAWHQAAHGRADHPPLSCGTLPSTWRKNPGVAQRFLTA